MKESKITWKLVITIIIVSLFSMLTFEMAYCHLMYKDYSQIYNEVQEMENRIDQVVDLNLKLQKYILNKEVKDDGF